MGVKVIVPAQLRQYTADQSTIEVDGGTVGDVLNELDRAHPGLRDRICESDGRLRRFVNVFVNGEDVRSLDGTETSVSDGDEVSIVPAVAGGSQ